MRIFDKNDKMQHFTTKNKSSVSTEYNFNSVEEIQSIPIPKYKSLSGLGSPVNNIEYILNRKATIFKKDGKKDLALACLRKANEIYPYSNFSWTRKDYMRIVEFLKYFGDFEQARLEEKYIIDNYSKFFSENVFPSFVKNECAIDDFIKKYKSVYYFDGSDLVSTETTGRACTCEECTKYRGRIFSVYGKDSRFPKLPDELRKMYIHEECKISFLPFIFFEGNVNTFSPTYDNSIVLNNSSKIIEYVNRPFVDDRSQDEKKYFEESQRKHKQEIQDKKDFDWLRENLPDIAPKSFGGYRKMKNSNSSNYQKIVKIALDNKYIIK